MYIQTFFWHCSGLNLEPNFFISNARHSGESGSPTKRAFVVGSVNSETRAISSIRPQSISLCPTVLPLRDSMVTFFMFVPSLNNVRSAYLRVRAYWIILKYSLCVCVHVWVCVYACEPHAHTHCVCVGACVCKCVRVCA